MSSIKIKPESKDTLHYIELFNSLDDFHEKFVGKVSRFFLVYSEFEFEFEGKQVTDRTYSLIYDNGDNLIEVSNPKYIEPERNGVIRVFTGYEGHEAWEALVVENCAVFDFPKEVDTYDNQKGMPYVFLNKFNEEVFVTPHGEILQVKDFNPKEHQTEAKEYFPKPDKRIMDTYNTLTEIKTKMVERKAEAKDLAVVEKSLAMLEAVYDWPSAS